MNDTRDPMVDDSTPGEGRRRQIGILLFDGVEEQDAVGPWEVLSGWTQQHPEDGWDAFCFSFDGHPVRSAKTLVLGAHTRSPTPPPWTCWFTPAGRAPWRCCTTAATSTGSAGSAPRFP